MSESGKGFRQGFGFGGGCCAAAVLIPFGCLCLIAMCALSTTDDAQAKESNQAVMVAREKANRLDKLKAAGVANPTQSAAMTMVDLKKQMRIEGVAETGVIESILGNPDQVEAIKPLKAAVAEAMVGKIDGEVLMLEELAGFKKGDLISDVMQQFDAPEHRGETNEVKNYGLAWPDLMYYSYDRADVTFLVKAGTVELILVGLVYRDAVR